MQGQAAVNGSQELQRLADEAMALDRSGHVEAAVASYQRLLAINPDWPEVLINCARLLNQLGRPDQAEALCLRAIPHRPDLADGFGVLGQALLDSHRPADALPICRYAVGLAPGRADFLATLAAALLATAQPEAAVATYREAIRAGADEDSTSNALGTALMAVDDLDQAIVAFGRAGALRPDYAGAFNNLGLALTMAGRWQEAAGAHETAIRLWPDDERLLRNLLLLASYRDDLDSDDLKSQRQRYGALAARLVPAPAPPPRPPLDERGRLRIGYLSADFHNHPLAGNLAPALAHADHDRFSVHLYSVGRREDAMTGRLRGFADHWTDISAMSDCEAARRIRADGIHILVRLGSGFEGNRPMIAAHRAAPVQISSHDASTSALTSIDFIFTDRHMVPGGQAEYFSERPLRLPRLYIAEMPTEMPALTDRPAGPPVFACFNNPAKIGPMVLTLWGRILAAMPEARLELKYLDRYRSAEVRSRLLTALIAAGATADQVVFVNGRELAGDFLARHNGIDVALDTFPFGGSTTTFQALAMGVPVVSWAWPRMVSRFSLDMLTAIGLDELVTDSADAYVTTALRVAADRADWRARRPAIRARLARSRLCDGATWMRRAERLYRAIWRLG